MNRSTILQVTFSFFLSALLTGCAASSSVQRSAPSSSKITNVATINESFDVVWDRMIKNLSSRFFVINNVEKTSRIMNVSFSADDPSQYVDCGTSTRIYNPPAGAPQTFIYRNADKTISFMTAANGMPVKVIATRSLDGRANIYVAPSADGKQTDISVNVRYTVHLNADAFGVDGYGNLIGEPYRSPADTWSFDTAASQLVQSDAEGQITCASRGILEEQIVATAKAQ